MIIPHQSNSEHRVFFLELETVITEPLSHHFNFLFLFCFVMRAVRCFETRCLSAASAERKWERKSEREWGVAEEGSVGKEMLNRFK